MPSTGRNFENIAPFVPRTGDILENKILGSDRVVKDDVSCNGLPFPGTLTLGQEAPDDEDGSTGDYFVFSDAQFTYVMVKTQTQWEELGRVPVGSPIDELVPIGWEFQKRTKEGTASLCGHSEFTSPSTPPKKYKVLTIDGEMEGPASTGCPDLPAEDGPRQYSPPSGFLCSIPDLPSNLTLRARIISQTGSDVTYRMTLSAAHALIQIDVNNDGIPDQSLGGVATFDVVVARGKILETHPRVFCVAHGGWTSMVRTDSGTPNAITVRAPATMIEDDWNYISDYNADLDTCTPQVSDTSQRLSNGSPTSWPHVVGPSQAYGDGADVTTGQVLRTTVGNNECDGNSRWIGTVTEALTDEDTEEDALDRFNSSTPFGSYGAWSGGWDAAQAVSRYEGRASGFDFDLIMAQCQMEFTCLKPYAHYTIKIELWRGPFDADEQGDYTFFEEVELAGDADAGGSLSFTNVEIDNDEADSSTIAIFKSITRN